MSEPADRGDAVTPIGRQSPAHPSLSSVPYFKESFAMPRRILVLTALPFLIAASAASGCLSEGGTAPAGSTGDGGTNPNPGGQPPLTTPDGGEVTIDADVPVGDPTKNDAIKDSTENITYMDDLATHPGCTTAGLDARPSIDGFPASYVPAVLPDFACAAKEFLPLNEDVTRPVILLAHGNSSTPRDWESNEDDPVKTVTMVANTLFNDGWHVYSADFRYDKVPVETANPAKNMDHGWTVPIFEALVRSVHKKYPTRKINVSGFSLGTTIIRDALRRMHHRGEKPFEYVHAVHLVSGANHGVKGYLTLCGGTPSNPTNKTMAGKCSCQMGNRDAYAPTPFSAVLNGPDGAYETPCADGINAYGQVNVCGLNRVIYTTAVHRDLPDGTLEDEFVSQQSAFLKGADNRPVAQDDTSKYFGNGAYPHHYGAIRSAEGVALAKAALER
jgi:hypothetical protein